MSTVASAATQDRAEAQEEYHDRPVPMHARLGFKEPALVWSGFGIAYICAVIGGLIQKGLGTVDAILAILLGNAILFVYSAAIGYASGKWGMNFPLTVRAVFGRKGAVLPVLVMAVLVTGWYAFQAWLTADILRVAFDLQGGALVGVLAAVIAVVFGLPVIFGIKSMARLMQLALPGMLIFAAYYLFVRILPAGGEILAKAGDGKIAFMTGVGMAWSTFVVSGTMTGDIVRYTKSGGQAVSVTAVAFLFSNAPFMIMGALIAASISDPNVQYFFDQRTIGVLLPLVVIAVLSNWSTCDACLYNAAMGYTNSIPGLNWRSAAIVGTVIGVIAAGTGVIGNIVNWLILLGLIVPPIGGAIIADYFVVRGNAVGFGRERDAAVNWAAVIAVLLGIAIGWWVNSAYPTFLFGVAGIVSSFVIYAVLAKVSPQGLGAAVSGRSSGAETVAG
jgi:cytosine permease